MIRNYIKIAWRSLLKNKGYSAINIGGLAVGMSVAILIGLWVWDELTANKHHANYDSIYQVKMHQTFDGHRGTQDALPYPMGDELKNKYPDFKAIAMCDWGSNRSLAFENNKYLKDGHYIGEQAIDLFSLKVLNGDKNPLQEPYSIVLNDETAKTIFGSQDPIGKTIKIDNATNLKVTAVVAKQPKNATLQFDYLLPWLLQEKIYPEIKNNTWGNNSYQVFVQLKDGVDFNNTNAKIKNVALNHFLDNTMMIKNIRPEVFIFPMAKWKLYSEFENGINSGGFIKYVRLFSLFGIFILVIACINFMNLSTARSEKRAKEVGLRKAVGSARSQLIGQFLSESTLIACLAFILAIAIVFLSLPFFNTLTDKMMILPFGNLVFWLILILFTLFTGLLAGSYPALYLSAFSPVTILKGGVHKGRGASMPRKILVVLQFTFSIVLMIGTILIYQQIQHGKNRPIGFDNTNLISINWSEDINKNFEALQHDLLATGAISSVCKSNSPPEQIYSNNNDWEWENSTETDKGLPINTIATTYNYAKTLGIKLKEGRDFSKEYSTDSNAVLLNEAAIKRMALKNPVGKQVKWHGKPLTIIGIIPDINMESPFRAIAPTVVIFDPNWVNFINLRFNNGVETADALEKITPIFNRHNPGFPFDYKFADKEYAKKFNYEELIGKLSLIVSILAIFISCLGLFGLASFMAEQRTKEIGIRKTLGASVANLWAMLSKDFVNLVIISCLIASPIAYYGMNSWLETYKDYKINIGAGVFIIVLFVALLITLLTVSYQAIKAALMNPVKSLKTE